MFEFLVQFAAHRVVTPLLFHSPPGKGAEWCILRQVLSTSDPVPFSLLSECPSTALLLQYAICMFKSVESHDVH